MRRFLRNRLAAWAHRRQGPDTPPVLLHSGRVYILPTRFGLAFGAMLLVMLIAGINYGNSLAMFLTFLLTGFALVSIHQCHRNLVRLSLTSAVASPAFAGTVGALRVGLANEAGFDRVGIEVAVPDGPAAAGNVPARGQASIELAIHASVRGLLRIDRLQVFTTHPFNLVRAWAWIHMPIEMIVYPRARGALPMPADDGSQAGMRAHGVAGADEWLGLRPFRDGDSPRQVAWTAYARGAPLLVKEYSALGAEMRVFDFSRLEGLGVESRLEQLARWVVDAEARGERYGLVVPARRIEPDSGPQHRHECLTALALHPWRRPADVR